VTRPTGSVVVAGAKRSALVLDGNAVKLRLEAARVETFTPVHVDWVRFTVLRRNSAVPDASELFPTDADLERQFGVGELTQADREERLARLIVLRRLLKDIPKLEDSAYVQALELGRQVVEVLGWEFTVNEEVRKGHDFYRFRLSIERNGVECGWVGFQAAGDSPKQAAQGRTLHVNLYGAACTFAIPFWNKRLADLVEQLDGTLTRVDLALDFFDGRSGGMDRVLEEYRSGLMDAGGKRLKCNMVGDWANGRERSFYVGSKEAGKQTNVYEKGDQMFGLESCSPWIRAELRYGNKLRELSVDMLRRPADFFAGASDWHAALLREVDSIPVPEAVKTRGRLAVETVQAEVTRNVRWAIDVAAPTLAAAWDFLGEQFLELVTHKKRPGRLQRFSSGELAEAYPRVMDRFFNTAEGAGPAFA
jgi:phage replication initiation protein